MPSVHARTRATARTPAAAPAGPLGTGKSNLGCMVFEGRTGIDARSTLYNRCGTGVRLNYCLQYKNGADNCMPMTIGWEATLWDLLAGQSLVYSMPETDTLTRWSIFACETPLTPWQAVFRGGNLSLRGLRRDRPRTAGRRAGPSPDHSQQRPVDLARRHNQHDLRHRLARIDQLFPDAAHQPLCPSDQHRHLCDDLYPEWLVALPGIRARADRTAD